MEIRIYYEDTDCAGLVYYANYLKYFERARTHYLEERGVSVGELLKDGTQFMVVRANIEYRAPGRYGDRLRIDTHISERGKAALRFAHVVRERTSGRVVVEGSATLVSVNAEGKIMRLPQPLLNMSALPNTGRTRRTDSNRKTRQGRHKPSPSA